MRRSKRGKYLMNHPLLKHAQDILCHRVVSRVLPLSLPCKVFKPAFLAHSPRPISSRPCLNPAQTFRTRHEARCVGEVNLSSLPFFSAAGEVSWAAGERPRPAAGLRVEDGLRPFRQEVMNCRIA